MKAPGDKELVLARYMEGPALLERALADVRDSELDAPRASGGWTIRQIVHHIVDGDDLWKTCIKMALGIDDAEFSLGWYWAQPQEVWAEKWAYEKRSVDLSLALLGANRNHVSQLLAHVPGAWNRSAVFRRGNGETEQVPVGAAIEIQADHLEHHVRQIRTIRSELDRVTNPT